MAKIDPKHYRTLHDETLEVFLFVWQLVSHFPHTSGNGKNSPIDQK
jgi:hypothetical protein